MKNFREYINIAANEYSNSDRKLSTMPIPVEQIYQIAMQLAKQDHEREVNAQRHEYAVEIERLRAKLRTEEPLSIKQKDYIATLSKGIEMEVLTFIGKVFGKKRLPDLTVNEASVLITALKNNEITKAIDQEPIEKDGDLICD